MEGARPARPEELSRCAELLGDARAALSGRRGGAQLLAVQEWSPGDMAAAWSAHADRILLAGLIDEVVVGVAAGHLRAGGPGPAPWVGLVDCCYVEPTARGVGVGTALARAIVEWFTGRGCAGVDVPALPGDRSTKQLFESLGFSARLLILHRQVQ